MRAIMTGAGTALALTLAGCGDRPAEEANRAGPANTVDAAKQLAALTEGQRNAVFIRAIRDAGEDCQGVESSTSAGEHQGYPVWSAQCEGGGSYTIVVTADGTAQVLNDAEARLAGLNEVAPQNDQAAPQNRQGQ